MGTMPWVYAHTDENEAFVAVGLNARRIKFFINGGKPQLIKETRREIGKWKKGRPKETSWDQIEKIVGFIEQVHQRKLLGRSSSSQINSLPGTEV